MTMNDVIGDDCLCQGEALGGCTDVTASTMTRQLWLMMGHAFKLMLVESVVVQVQFMSADVRIFLRAIVTAWGIRKMPWETAEAPVKRMSTTMACVM